MSCYLFVHFRETTSPEGEQVYFAVSRDGFNWTSLNDQKPILWAYYGDKGVRDMTVVRDIYTGKFHIFATDLSLSYGLRGKYNHSWQNISRHGSKSLAHWESDDLINWTEEELIQIADDDFGCVWAPDIILDRESGDYLLHFSSSHIRNNFGDKGIFYVRTRDFKRFSKPEIMYAKEDGSVIDSAMYEEDGAYYLFVKSQSNPTNIQLLTSDKPTGGFTVHEGFSKALKSLEGGMYEAPTAIKLDDGRWCLFIDFFGVRGSAQGYIPFIADSIKDANFKLADESFSFPYRFKHGTVLKITEDEYERMLSYDWSTWKDGR